MNTDDISRALMPYIPGTLVVVRLKAAAGGYVEIPIVRAAHVPAEGDADAYVAFVTYPEDYSL